MSHQPPPVYADLTRLAAQVGLALRDAGLMMATAESCTGGLVGHLITEVAGSSAYFAGGAIVYSNHAKEKILGVSPVTLYKYGAVSFPAAQEMAQGARRLYDVDVAVAITGIAGPGGDTPDKPVGTTYIHISAIDGFEQGDRFIWPSDRSGNKLLSAQAALILLQSYLAQRTAR